MIGKITKGDNPTGALQYAMSKDEGKLIDTNCVSRDAAGIGAEMDAVAAGNRRCEKHCIHITLSSPPGEKLTDEQWKKAAEITCRELGLGDRQYALVRHGDREHDHAHLMVERVDANGKAWNDSRDYQRLHTSMRVVEKEMGLQSVPTRQATRDGRFELVRSGLRESVKATRGRGLYGLKDEMGKRGYDVIENRQSTGRLAGLSIRSREDGKTWKASELQRGGARSIIAQLDKQREQEHQTRTSNAAVVGSAARKALAGVLPGGGLALRVARAASKTAASTNKKQRAMEK